MMILGIVAVLVAVSYVVAKVTSRSERSSDRAHFAVETSEKAAITSAVKALYITDYAYSRNATQNYRPLQRWELTRDTIDRWVKLGEVEARPMEKSEQLELRQVEGDAESGVSFKKRPSGTRIAAFRQSLH